MNRFLIHMPKRLLVAAALAGLGTAALAQGQQPSASAPVATATAPAASAAGHEHLTHEQWRARMEQHHAQQLEQLKTALKLTADQEPAWDQFEAAMQPPAPSAQQPGGPEEWAKLTTPERIDRIEQRTQEHQQRMKQFGDAVKAFYAQLTPAQQKTFDDSPALFPGPRMMGKEPGRNGHGKRPGRHHHAPAAKPAAEAASQAE